MNTMVSFDHVINNDKDNIISFINEMCYKNENSVNSLKAIIENSSFYNKYEVLSVSDDTFLKNILMCLVYSGIDPYLANTPIMERYREKIKLVCHELGLNENNIVPICTIEEKLINALIL